ncbi:MAG: dTMP kinase [Planctomycetes bacterium]|nr:dTMP kinase [Planctomycetota bacterium]
MNSKFIALDGVDGCGKSTQAAALAAALAEDGREVLHLREPGSTAFGEAIREILLKKNIPRGVTAEILAFFTARAQLLEEKIEPALARGAWIVCERWVSSTYAYQSAASGGSSSTVLALEQLVVRRAPDLLLILDLPAADAAKRLRGGPDDIERRGLQYLEKVRNGFLEYSSTRAFVKIVDARGTPAEVGARVAAEARRG